MWDILNNLGHWHWFILGLILLIAEAFGAAGFALGAAIGSLATGIIVWLIGDPSWEFQIILGAVLATVSSLVYWRFFRADLQESDRPQLNQKTAQYIGRKLTLDKDIDFEGRIQIGDTFWKVKSEVSLKSGDVIEVVSADETTLNIQKVS